VSSNDVDVDVQGDVGVLLNNPTIQNLNIHVQDSGTQAEEQEVKRLVSALLKFCDTEGCRSQIEQVAETVYGGKVFLKLKVNELRALIDVARIVVTCRDQALNAFVESQAIPQELARICPQCGIDTWKATKLCRQCNYDLAEHDDLEHADIVEKRKFKVLIGCCGLAAILAMSAKILPSGYSMTAYIMAGMAMLFGLAAAK